MKLYSLLLLFHVLGVQSVLAIGGDKAMKRLLRQLFTETDYNPIVRPASDYSQPTVVQLQLSVFMLQGLDIKHQILSLHGYLHMSWFDEDLNWNPAEFGGIKAINVPQAMVWRPDIVYYNSIDSDEGMYPGSEQTQVKVTHKGWVVWEPVFTLKTTCMVDISKYPFDVNVCPITLHSWMSDNKTVLMEFTEKEHLDSTYYIPNGQYKLALSGVYSKFFDFVYDTETLYFQQVGFLLRIERRPAYLCLCLLMPVALLAILSIVSFMLPPDHADKLNVSISVLLSFTIFLGVIDNDTPENSDNMSYLVVYISIMLAHAFLCVLGNALVMYIHRKETLAHMGQTCEEKSADSEEPLEEKSANHKNPPVRFCNAQTDGRRTDFLDNVTCCRQRARPRTKAQKANRFLFMLNSVFIVSFTTFTLIKLVE